MDVRCNRCGTEYEFDDALISERGTTVKCTHCGHQFKVFGSRSEKGVPERWTVRTSDGREIVYSDLRELQSDILERKVNALDRLSRGNQAPRQLRSIAELAPFFRDDGARRRAQQEPPDSAPSVESVTAPRGSAAASLEDSGPGADGVSANGPPGADAETPTDSAPLSEKVTTVRGAVPNLAISEAALDDSASREPPATAEETPTRGAAPPNSPLASSPLGSSPLGSSPLVSSPLPSSPLHSSPLGSSPLGSAPLHSSPLHSSPLGSSPVGSAPLHSSPSNPKNHFEELSGAPPSVGRRSLRSGDEITGSPPSVGRRPLRSGSELSALPPPVSRRKSYEELSASPPSVSRRNLRSYDELTGAPASVGRRSQRSYENLMGLASVGRHARSRWIAVLVIGALAALFLLTVGRRYLPESVTSGRPGEALRSHRVAELLREGQRLIDDGDFEGASEPLLRASALSEKDPAVLATLARLATQRADLIWLKLRLLDPKLTELTQATRKELGKRVGKARTAVDAAFAVAPEDIVVIRARVDALRLSGEATEAREWIRPIAANASDPQNAYVLAALDLADAAPSWASAIDRLKTAANGERTPARAQAALIYALARSGRISEAEAELGRLDSGTSGALLIDELRAFVKRSATSGRGPGTTDTETIKAETLKPGGSAAPAASGVPAQKAPQARGDR